MNVHDLSHRYSDIFFNKKIAILGPYPPPLGGVSVHIKRVIKKLQHQNNTVYHFETTVEYRYRWFIFYVPKLIIWLLFYRPDVVMCHTMYLSNSRLELLLLVKLNYFLRYQLMLIEHNCRHVYNRNYIFKKSLQYVLQQTNTIILIGDVTHKSYADNNIKLPINWSIEGAFLPPDETRESAIIKTYPLSLTAFIKKHMPIILVNASQLVLLDNKDLYGIDQCILLLATLKEKHANVGLIIVLAQIGDANYFATIQQKIKKNNLENNIYILHGQKELWPLLKECDVFVRPTLSDSFGISVQEALHFGKPVVASNVCARPKNTVLFDTDNKQDFIKKVEEVLERIYEPTNQQRHYLHEKQNR